MIIISNLFVLVTYLNIIIYYFTCESSINAVDISGRVNRFQYLIPIGNFFLKKYSASRFYFHTNMVYYYRELLFPK